MAFLLTVGIGAGVLYAWGQQYEGRVLPGVRVGSTELGGLTREQAEAAITNAYGSLGTGQITLTGPNGQTTISYADLGRGPDTSAVLDAALAAGRQGEPLANLIGAPQVALHGVTLDSAVAYDRDKLTAAVETLATTTDQTPVDATVSAGPGRDVQRLPGEGRSRRRQGGPADRARPAARRARHAGVDHDGRAARVVGTRCRHRLGRGGEGGRGSNGRRRGRHPGQGQLDDRPHEPRAADLVLDRGRREHHPVFDESGLDPILKTLAKDVNRTAKDAGLKLVGGHIVATGTSHEGRTLIADGMKAALISEIGARQTGAAASPVEAVVKAVNPKLTTADAKAFAPKMRPISQYSVYYFVIVNNHWGGNIEGPATVINGTVVPAGAKFDFWKVVGDLRKAPGTGPGNAIEGGKITVTGAFGGGICTTSTTLFNAAFRAGMMPLARKNHNEFINRYPPGLDATVWIVGNTKQTMSFKNDTKYPILISRTITHAGSKRWLTFKIWSVPNGRKATVTNTVIQPGERAVHKTVKDPTKPVGYTFFNNAAVNGAKVWTTVTIYDHGKLHWRKRYFSNYPAVDGVTIVGTRGT